MLTKGKKMPDISKFKSVSVSVDTHKKLEAMAKSRFEVPVSIQKLIDFLIVNTPKKVGKRRAR